MIDSDLQERFVWRGDARTARGRTPRTITDRVAVRGTDAKGTGVTILDLGGIELAIIAVIVLGIAPVVALVVVLVRRSGL